MPLKQFIEYDDSKTTLSEVDENVLKMRQSRSLYRQMLDVWGEVSGCIDAYKKYKKHKLAYEDMLIQFDSFHRMCCTVYDSPGISDGAKWELRVAEWELYDFTLWKNEFHNTIKSVTGWFDEWCYQAV